MVSLRLLLNHAARVPRRFAFVLLGRCDELFWLGHTEELLRDLAFSGQPTQLQSGDFQVLRIVEDYLEHPLVEEVDLVVWHENLHRDNILADSLIGGFDVVQTPHPIHFGA